MSGGAAHKPVASQQADIAHEGDCLGTLCPDCGCCCHCADGDGHCGGCKDPLCGCSL